MHANVHPRGSRPVRELAELKLLVATTWPVGSFYPRRQGTCTSCTMGGNGCMFPCTRQGFSPTPAEHNLPAATTWPISSFCPHSDIPHRWRTCTTCTAGGNGCTMSCTWLALTHDTCELAGSLPRTTKPADDFSRQQEAPQTKFLALLMAVTLARSEMLFGHPITSNQSLGQRSCLAT